MLLREGRRRERRHGWGGKKTPLLALQYASDNGHVFLDFHKGLIVALHLGGNGFYLVLRGLKLLPGNTSREDDADNHDGIWPSPLKGGDDQASLS
jgi:hypothetical protein